MTAFKAAIWALGHIGSTEQGLELLLCENAVDDLIELAEECPLLSIRGCVCVCVCVCVCGASVRREHCWCIRLSDLRMLLLVRVFCA